MQLPLHIFEGRYREMIGHCIETHTPFGVVLIRSGEEIGGPAEPHAVGTSALVSRVERLADGRLNIEAVGQERFRVADIHREAAYLEGTVERFPLRDIDTASAHQSALALRPWLVRYLGLLSKATHTSFSGQQIPTEPAPLAYLAAVVAQIPLEEKQCLLATDSAPELLMLQRRIYRREISLIRAMLRPRPADGGLSPN